MILKPTADKDHWCLDSFILDNITLEYYTTRCNMVCKLSRVTGVAELYGEKVPKQTKHAKWINRFIIKHKTKYFITRTTLSAEIPSDA